MEERIDGCLNELRPATEVEADLARIVQACRARLAVGELAWMRAYLDALAELRVRQSERRLREAADRGLEDPPPEPASAAHGRRSGGVESTGFSRGPLPAAGMALKPAVGACAATAKVIPYRPSAAR